MLNLNILRNIPTNVIKLANVEKGARTFKFLMQFNKMRGKSKMTI